MARSARARLTNDFAATLIGWQGTHGRHDLPWQNSLDPYPIWVSEIMLQQTQVAAVIAYFTRFMARFPTVAALAAAPIDDVLAAWSGLGYYARARNLHLAACVVVAQHGGRFPDTRAALQALPGIGRSTAAAIVAFSCGAREAILDGNVKRVLTRHFAVPGFPGAKAVETPLWQLAESLLPDAKLGVYTQALMDLGATVCTRARPRCTECPLQASCRALQLGRVADFPAPRPRRARPLRQQTLWLLRDKTRCLLERRPAKGVWGGLWSLPETLPAWAAGTPAEGDTLQLRHEFTHFSLDMTVEVRRVDSIDPQASASESTSEQRWWPLDEALQQGLPAPIRRVLRDALAMTGTLTDRLFSEYAVHPDTTAATPGAPVDPPEPGLVACGPAARAGLLRGGN